MIIRKKTIIYLLLWMILGFNLPAYSQEARINQKKIDREREKKQKAAAKEYKQAIKRHHDIQSKNTKKSMKRTRRESRSVTPVGH